MAEQWLRQLSLIVAPASGQNGIELSSLRVNFKVTSPIQSTPATMSARVYNPSPQTVSKIMALPSDPSVAGALTGVGNPGQVVLRAGYEGNFGVIFAGNVMQVRRGRENPVDDFIDIFAADGDWAHQWGTINTALAAGWTPSDVAKSVGSAFAQYGITDGGFNAPGVPAPAAPRGKVMVGMARDVATQITATYQVNWSFHNGQLEWLPISAYKPGDTVLITDKTGMIGLPEQTQSGIIVRCLLNPSLSPGIQIKLQNEAIQRAQFSATAEGAALNAFYNNSVNVGGDTDGVYKILLLDHIGDTRGNDWYSQIDCASINPANTPPSAVIGLIGPSVL